MTGIVEDIKVVKVANTKAKPAEVQVFEREGCTFVDIRDLAHDKKEIILESLDEVMGYHECRSKGGIFPINDLVGIRDSLETQISVNGGDVKEAGYADVLKAVDEYSLVLQKQLSHKLLQGHLEFEDIGIAFKAGDEVFAFFGDQKVGGTIKEVTRQNTFFGPRYLVKMNVISNVFGSLRDDIFNLYIGYFRGFTKLSDLPIVLLDENTKAELVARGEKFRKYSAGAQYIHYTGQLTRSSWYGPRNYRADGRAMIDVSSFSQVDNNQFSSEGYQSGLENRRDESNNREFVYTIQDADLWRTYPYLYGFSLSVKQWGRFAVNGLNDINFREDAFEKLVLPNEDKELVKAIVQDDGSDFSDLIDGKGGGSIFLLHGPPGQGKTLTAEAIAEDLKRPLYSISVGELGTSPDSLEGTLREILDVATVWNAVLLLDEADIFLEERDEKDIVRNAMVGVFLRLLEYHQGVMFLTTNRVRNIDQAFYSRISIGLRFGDATVEKRKSIWNNLSSSAGLSGLDLDALAQHDLNGRQIKNVIRLAIKLSRSKGDVVTQELITNVIGRTGNFSNESVPGETVR